MASLATHSTCGSSARAETGNCRAITNYQQGCRHKITDGERFRAVIEQHGGKTQAQLAALWGEGVTQQNISRAMQKLGISRKKELMATLNATKPSAQPFASN